MKFTVVWAPVVQNRLAELWLEATDQNAIAQAANRIDALLASDPEQPLRCNRPQHQDAREP